MELCNHDKKLILEAQQDIAVGEAFKGNYLLYMSYFFHCRKKRWPLINKMHIEMCAALDDVVAGKCKRLIINISPRCGKTEFVSIGFPAYGLAYNPASLFIATSYAKNLVIGNSNTTKEIIRTPEHLRMYPDTIINDKKTDSANEWYTTKGGGLYAAPTFGQLTGFGAGSIYNDKFSGAILCFPYWQEIITDKGVLRIGDIVENNRDISVLSYNHEQNTPELKPIERYFKNPSSDIFRVMLNDGTTFDCTPEHKIFTVNRGYVEAKELSRSDILPTISGLSTEFFKVRNGDVKSFANFCTWDRSIFYYIKFLLCKLAWFFLVVIDFSVSNIFPSFSTFYFDYASFANTISDSKVGNSIFRLGNFFSGFFAKFCPKSFLVNFQSSVAKGIGGVLRHSAVSKIAQGVVRRVPVKVSDYMFSLFADKSPHNYLVKFNFLSGIVPIKCRNAITKFINTKLFNSFGQNSSGSVFRSNDSTICSDPEKIRNTIIPNPIRNRSPLFVFKISHVDTTYCLTVKDNHNILLHGNQPTIVSNCDDMLKPAEANSDIMREKTNSAFVNTIYSRRNNPETPIIVIMQRLHENDLTGFLLDGGTQEHWDLVKIPILDGSGNPTWEYKYPKDYIDKLRKQDIMTFSGQYMQEPSPEEGTIIKVKEFKSYDDLPQLSSKVMVVDSAWEEKEQNDFTVFDIWGDRGNDSYLVDKKRFKCEFAYLEDAFMEFYRKHNPKLVIIEKKASGIALISVLKSKYNIPIIEKQPSVSKVERVRGISPFIVQGKVHIPSQQYLTRRKEVEKQYSDDWLGDFQKECKNFPLGKHDDNIDCMELYLSYKYLSETGQPLYTSFSRDYNVGQVRLTSFMPIDVTIYLGENSVNVAMFSQFSHTYQLKVIDCIISENGNTTEFLKSIEAILKRDYSGFKVVIYANKYHEAMQECFNDDVDTIREPLDEKECFDSIETNMLGFVIDEYGQRESKFIIDKRAELFINALDGGIRYEYKETGMKPQRVVQKIRPYWHINECFNLLVFKKYVDGFGNIVQQQTDISAAVRRFTGR